MTDHGKLLREVDVLVAIAPDVSSRRFAIGALPLLQELAEALRVVLKERDEANLAAGAEAQLANEYHAGLLRAEEALRKMTTEYPMDATLPDHECADFHYDTVKHYREIARAYFADRAALSPEGQK